MRFVFYTNSVSAHQLPLARELVRRLGRDRVLYVSTDVCQGGAQELDAKSVPDVTVVSSGDASVREVLESAEVLYTGLRCPEVMERRAAKGLVTLYYSERYFKPIPLVGRHCAPGHWRLASPRYHRCVRRIANLVREAPNFYYLPVGPWARADMARLTKGPLADARTIDWGYFVSPSEKPRPTAVSPRSARFLWVGRMLDWKRVDSIVRAVGSLGPSASLTLVGDGPERARLEALARPFPRIRFVGSQTPSAVRETMRGHDCYILASDAREGWGAALNEALEEGMAAVGTYEAGASAAMLPASGLFHAGDWRALANLLKGELPAPGIGPWSAREAAARLCRAVGSLSS